MTLQQKIQDVAVVLLFLYTFPMLPNNPSNSYPASLQEQVDHRDQPGDNRPKSSYMVRDGSPQSPRDKRPLSGPNIRTPNLPVTEGVMKTTQQTTRPFNTYPRTDSEGGRSPTGQVEMAV